LYRCGIERKVERLKAKGLSFPEPKSLEEAQRRRTQVKAQSQEAQNHLGRIRKKAIADGFLSPSDQKTRARTILSWQISEEEVRYLDRWIRITKQAIQPVPTMMPSPECLLNELTKIMSRSDTKMLMGHSSFKRKIKNYYKGKLDNEEKQNRLVIALRAGMDCLKTNNYVELLTEAQQAYMGFTEEYLESIEKPKEAI
jgi:hypothetical protein